MFPTISPRLLLVTSLVLLPAVTGGVSAATNGLTVVIRNPADGHVLTGKTRWNVEVDGGTPSWVDFFVDGRLRWTERAQPYRFNGDEGAFSTASVTPGKHVLRAVARSTSGVASATVTVLVKRGGLGSQLPARLGPSRGKQYFVDGQSGTDSNRGTLKAPWRTIARAWSVATAGSIVNVRAGSYSGQVNLINKAANAANPITVRAYPGDHVTLTGPTAPGYPAVYIWRSTGVRLQGFEITNRTGDGVKVDSSWDIAVSNNDIHNVGQQGIIVGGSNAAPTYSKNVQIWDNRIHDNGGWWENNDPYALSGTHGIYYGNTVSNSDGIRHGAVGGLIANNLFYNQPNGFHIQVGSQDDGLIITNNTFDHATAQEESAGNAIQLYGEDNQFATKNVVVVNNVIANSAHRGLYGSGPTLEGNIALNNLAFDNPLGDFVPTTGSSVLFTLGPGNVTGQDPLFSDPKAGNYRPAAGSPLIDRANPEFAPTRDASGRSRSGRPDIGAFEYTR